MRKLRTHELNRLEPDQYRQAEKAPLVVVLDNVRSGNNIGSVFRTCDALLVQSLFLCGITATPPNKDIHKTALNAEKNVDWHYFARTQDAVATLKAEGFRIFAVEQIDNSIMLHRFKPEPGEKLALIFGNEVKGVQQKVIDLCNGAIEIPQYGTKHSFNVSVSAGIVLWDLFNKIKKGPI
ncbi:MAG: RNA methyltransferase [Prolixibacteraceae bacterium]